jgi:hypothetical protein
MVLTLIGLHGISCLPVLLPACLGQRIHAAHPFGGVVRDAAEHHGLDAETGNRIHDIGFSAQRPIGKAIPAA